MKDCELCESPARMYCESDQAILCWGCDAKVHSANFLVARHSRNLLCHVCQSPTPWKASGSKLGPTISVCDRCTTTTPFNHPQPASKITSHHQQQHPEEADDEIDDDDAQDDDFDTQDDDFDDDDEEEEEEEQEEDEEDGENQVVPWSSAAPPITSSSSSDESLIRYGSASSPLKRMRENADFCSSQDDLGCSSSNQTSSIEEESMCFGSFSPLNDRKKKVTVSVRSEWRFGREKAEEEKVCKDQTAVDLVSTPYRSR
ncbi:hypothetical protein MRB53_021694 [Persea americana]|uniref:Uncharacterized protein n=1 Tax=Persea americana TaxID=3435 RepID=A0ACC2L4V2_PERAE|nr:hypothetical protein MRB53_021694 [Persea americana]